MLEGMLHGVVYEIVCRRQLKLNDGRYEKERVSVYERVYIIQLK